MLAGQGVVLALIDWSEVPHSDWWSSCAQCDMAAVAEVQCAVRGQSRDQQRTWLVAVVAPCRVTALGRTVGADWLVD